MFKTFLTFTYIYHKRIYLNTACVRYCAVRLVFCALFQIYFLPWYQFSRQQTTCSLHLMFDMASIHNVSTHVKYSIWWNDIWYKLYDCWIIHHLTLGGIEWDSFLQSQQALINFKVIRTLLSDNIGRKSIGYCLSFIGPVGLKFSEAWIRIRQSS